MALHHATSGEVISLAPLGGGLASGQSHALVKTDRFEAIRLIVPAGPAGERIVEALVARARRLIGP